MTATKFYPNQDDPTDTPSTFPQTRANATPVTDVIHPFPGETFGDIVKRAYGVNTHELRERIRKANTNLQGPINAPRS
jgi:hypothetical protein